VLELGYEAHLKDNSVAIKVGGLENPFVTVLTHNQSTKHFQITCLITTIGLMENETVYKFAVAALDANSRIMPFAYALITESTDPENDDDNEWPVVLTHAIPIGDFSKSELESAMHSLVKALMDGHNVLDLLRDGN
jgi:hypothetical protein